MSLDMAGVDGSVRPAYDVDGVALDGVPEPAPGAAQSGDDLPVQAAPVEQLVAVGGDVAAVPPAGEEAVALPGLEEAFAAEVPAALDVAPEVPAEPSGRSVALSVNTRPAPSSSKYGYRYVYSYRYSAVVGRLIRVLRPVMRPRLAVTMHAAKPTRSSKASVRGARHQMAPEVRQAHIDLLTAWRDGMQQLHTPSVSNYERIVDARQADDEIDGDATDADATLVLGD